MRRTLVVAVALVLAVAGMVSAEALSEIRVGVSAPLTGPAPVEGKCMRQGVELAIREANEAGGILGLPVRAVVYDDQHSPTAAVNVLNRLLSEDRVHVQIGPHRSVVAMSVEPVLRRNPVPMLTGATSPKLTELGNPYLFRVRANDSVMARIAAKYVVERMKARRIGIFYNNDDYGRDAAREVEKALRDSYGMQPVAVEVHNTGDKDMTSQLLKFERAGAEVVIVWTHVPEGAVVTRQWRELGLDKEFKLFGSPTFSNKPWFDLVLDQADGILSVNDFVVTNPAPHVRSWVNEFRKTYGEDPDMMASAYHDAALLALDAIRRAGSLEPGAIRGALATAENFQGVMTRYTFDRYGNGVHQALIISMKGRVPLVIDAVALEPER